MIVCEKEYDSVHYNRVHNMFVSMSIKGNVEQRSSANFVILIDKSSSMKGRAFSYVLATIQYLLERMTNNDNICIITFNTKCEMITEGLESMTDKNRHTLIDKLKLIHVRGETDLSAPLFTALELVKNVSKLTNIMLFTDGYANRGICGKELEDTLREYGVNSNVSLHTFGYGTDHDAHVLKNLPLCIKGGGLYYYIKDKESIATTFCDSLNIIQSTIGTNLLFRIQGKEGCRVVNLSTKNIYDTNTIGKDYRIYMGHLYGNQEKFLLFRVSLNKLPCEIDHDILKLIVSYDNLYGNPIQFTKDISISRTKENIKNKSLSLDRQINIIRAASIMEQCSSMDSYQKCIQKIHKSESGQQGLCNDILSDLGQCIHDNYKSLSLSSGYYTCKYGDLYDDGEIKAISKYIDEYNPD